MNVSKERNGEKECGDNDKNYRQLLKAYKSTSAPRNERKTQRKKRRERERTHNFGHMNTKRGDYIFRWKAFEEYDSIGPLKAQREERFFLETEERGTESPFEDNDWRECSRKKQGTTRHAIFMWQLEAREKNEPLRQQESERLEHTLQ